MVRQLTIGLHGGGIIVMHADGPEEKIPFDGLGGLLCLKPGEAEETGFADAELVAPDRMPEDRHTLKSTPLTETAYTADWSRVLITGWKKKPRQTHYYRCSVWQKTLIYAELNAILRGENAVLAHCTALETERGAVLLFGESGMGKSTASARWRANGGKNISDDMALLDFSGDGEIFIRRMPTWSACREGKNEWNYPADEELPLAEVLGLGRSETGRDMIVPLSPAQFFAQCYRSLFYWNLFYAKELPEEKQRVLTTRIRTQVETITKRFAPRALLTVLEGDLKKVIEDEL